MEQQNGAEKAEEPGSTGPRSADLTDEEIRALIGELSRRLAKSLNSSLLCLFFPDQSVLSKEHAVTVYDLFRENGSVDDLALFLHSEGGDIASAYDIISLCRHYAKGRIIALVPQWAMSAATLIALGADELIISKIGKLGPLDPVVNHPKHGWIPVRAITDIPRVLAQDLHQFQGSGGELPPDRMIAIKAEAIIRPMAQQADPYIHAAFALTPEVAKKYGEKVLAAKKVSREKCAKCLDYLIHAYPIHGFELDARELKENPTFKDVVKVSEPSKAVEDHMMDLLKTFLLLEEKHRQDGEGLQRPLIELIPLRKAGARSAKSSGSPRKKIAR